MRSARYNDWKHCITVKCGIPLTAGYVTQRITALNNARDHHTQKFRETWGDEYLNQVIGWFETAKSEL